MSLDITAASSQLYLNKVDFYIYKNCMYLNKHIEMIIVFPHLEIISGNALVVELCS